ncbi:MAG: 2-oxoacid:acceptor oxidoreductase family protein [Candidatus Hodarchaeota archaeon]
MLLTVRFAGYGGYGVVTASRILGQAFSQDHFHVLQTESHGAAARGGACTADLTISTDPIYELEFRRPDVLIILSTPAFKKCCSISPDLTSNLLLIEADLVDDSIVLKGLADLPKSNKIRIYKAQIRKVAEELGDVRYMGIASLGALATVDDRVDLKQLEKTIKTDTKLRRFEQQNLRALHEGTTAVSLLKPTT